MDLLANDGDLIPEPQLNYLAAAAQRMKTQALSHVIVTREDAELAQEMIVSLRKKKEEVTAYFQPSIDRAEALLKAERERRAEQYIPLDEAQKHLSEVLMRWQQEEKDRVAKALAEAKAQAARKAEEEREAQIEAAEASGAPREYVQSITEAPLQISTPVVVVGTPKLKGFWKRDNWSGVVRDYRKFYEHVAATPGLSHLLKEDQTALNAYARSTKGRIPIPGVEWVNNPVPMQRKK